MTSTSRANLATSHGGGGNTFGASIAEGKVTEVIYELLQAGKYSDVIAKLSVELQNFPRSRAALSLLAYSHYMIQDFPNAVRMYDQLVKICPDVQEYRVYYAQSLYKAGLYSEAARAAHQVEEPQQEQRMAMLLAAIKYQQDDLRGCVAQADNCLADDPDVIICHACVAYKEGKYEEALGLFRDAHQTLGFQADVAHNIALCHYQLGDFAPAQKLIADIIERGVREHPELGVGSKADGIDLRSVGNSQVLRETALIEAFNLKAAIEFAGGEGTALAREALADMPPRSEEQLDPVSLHNDALMNMEADFNAGCRKLNFLLDNPPHPPQAFGNLLLLYCREHCYDLAADVLAEHAHLTFKLLAPELYDFLDATMMAETSPEEAFRKYDDLANQHVEALRKLTKGIQDARVSRDADAVKEALAEYDAALERYVPVLMAMARIYWDKGHYAMVERIFRASSEFCGEHDVWRLNLAHVFFMQGKYKQSIHYYEPAVKKADVLDVTAIVLANLCVAYIMTSQNEKAEDLMRRIEKEEEKLAFDEPDKNSFHLCIVNLVIGTLYCSKGNFEFGISRVIKSLEPFDRKLGTETWHYAKRCFLALAESLAKHMLMLPDVTFHEILDFLAAAEKNGKKVDKVVPEARLLRKLYISLMD